ncbi:uncharacterized protein G2W53_014395 [Senna tora]|uniref:Uncharacterized protein n=1 Tax=Senna tora TaxID=362788 RepID=A0A834WTG3_9FABA|nr:uncharacterized protein G2W53_014395 [Senna tora]
MDTTNALQQEIVRLQPELESSNARFESSNAQLEASNARLEASNAQLKLEMRGVFNILKNIMGNVPSEFAHMINSETLTDCDKDKQHDLDAQVEAEKSKKVE